MGGCVYLSAEELGEAGLTVGGTAYEKVRVAVCDDKWQVLSVSGDFNVKCKDKFAVVTVINIDRMSATATFAVLSVCNVLLTVWYLAETLVPYLDIDDSGFTLSDLQALTLVNGFWLIGTALYVFVMRRARVADSVGAVRDSAFKVGRS